MKYLLLFFITFSVFAKTYQKRVDDLFKEKEDPRTYVYRCGGDASIGITQMKIKLEKNIDEAFVACMEAKKVDVDKEKSDREAIKVKFEIEREWLKTYDCETYNAGNDKERFLKFLCYYFKR